MVAPRVELDVSRLAASVGQGPGGSDGGRQLVGVVVGVGGDAARAGLALAVAHRVVVIGDEIARPGTGRRVAGLGQAVGAVVLKGGGAGCLDGLDDVAHRVENIAVRSLT